MIKIKQLYFEDNNIPIKNLDNNINPINQSDEKLTNHNLRGRKMDSPDLILKKNITNTLESKEKIKKGIYLIRQVLN